MKKLLAVILVPSIAVIGYCISTTACIAGFVIAGVTGYYLSKH